MSEYRLQLERDFPFLFEGRSEEEKEARAETYRLGFYDVGADVEKMIQDTGPPVPAETLVHNHSIEFLLDLLCRLCARNDGRGLWERTVECINAASADSSPEAYHEKKDLILAALREVSGSKKRLGLIREAERRVDLLLEAARHGKTAGEQQACWIYREPGLVLQIRGDGRNQRSDCQSDLFDSVKLMCSHEMLESELQPYLEDKSQREANNRQIFRELKGIYPELRESVSHPADIDYLSVGRAATTILGQRQSPPLKKTAVEERLRYARLTIEHATDPAAFVRKYREEFETVA